MEVEVPKKIIASHRVMTAVVNSIKWILLIEYFLHFTNDLPLIITKLKLMKKVKAV